ncbi:hypothetical protein ALC53_02209, partial [Atta colombica]
SLRPNSHHLREVLIFCFNMKKVNECKYREELSTWWLSSRRTYAKQVVRVDEARWR